MANARNVIRLLQNFVDGVFVDCVETELSSQDQVAFEKISKLFLSLCKSEQGSSSQSGSSQPSQSCGIQLRNKKIKTSPMNTQSSSSFEPSSQMSEEHVHIDDISETNRNKIKLWAEANLKSKRSLEPIRRTYGISSNREIYKLINQGKGMTTRLICYSKIRSYVIKQVHLHRYKSFV